MLTTEKKVLYGVTGATILGVLLFLISMATDYWIILHIPQGVYRNATNAYVKDHHSGLWRICRREINNHTSPTIIREYCRMIKLFPTSTEVEKDPEIDIDILHFSRTETAFAVISLMMMALGHVFAVYAIKEPRYMFKRLAALMHLITAVCILVAAEVLINSVNYEQENLPARHPPGAYFSYGYSFVLAWITFVIFVVATVVFAVCSRKKKRDKAESEKAAIENEPVHLGRV